MNFKQKFFLIVCPVIQTTVFSMRRNCVKVYLNFVKIYNTVQVTKFYIDFNVFFF